MTIGAQSPEIYALAFRSSVSRNCPTVGKSPAEFPARTEIEMAKVPSPRFSFINTIGASNKVPRQINRDLIFNQIRTGQPISRAELARVSGLQRSTVSVIVKQLLIEEWIVEGSTGRLPRGRRPTFLNLNEKRGVLALDILPSQTTMAVMNLDGAILAQHLIVLPEDSQEAIDVIVRSIQEMIVANGDRCFDGIGMILPGRFNFKMTESTSTESRRIGPSCGETLFAPNVSWPIGQIKARVEDATGLLVVVDNVANACALSEIWFSGGDGMHDLVVVNVSEEIGTGIFANGRIVRGEGRLAGEFGHVQMEPNGLECSCGNRGCWETVASNRAGVRYYLEITNERPRSFDALLKLAVSGDPAGKAAIDKMCVWLGRGMRMIAAALAPREIVVVGDITPFWYFIGPLIEAEVSRNGLVKIPRLRPAQEGNRARLRSAVALVMSENWLFAKSAN
jgi:predicted NBD/HSP70 family sugar kinase/predicted transcriptional regulator